MKLALSWPPTLMRCTWTKKGPTEVAHAAKVFNAMQTRIAAYLNERMQPLAAISHDLQTPT